MPSLRTPFLDSAKKHISTILIKTYVRHKLQSKL
jgi:hypothetical protein